MSEQLKEYLGKIIDGEADSLVTLHGGAAVEMMDRAIRKVIQNICDINTGMGVREVTLKLKAKPMDDSRTMVAWGIDVPPPKLQGQEPVATISHIEIDAGGKGFVSREKANPQRALPGFDNITQLKQ